MKKLLRLLVGAKRVPQPQERSAPAHELALKAVARRLLKQANDESVAEISVAAAELPVVIEKSVSAVEGAVGQADTMTPSRRLSREERRHRRVTQRLTSGASEVVVDAGAGATTIGQGDGKLRSSVLKRQGRRQRRLKQRRLKQTHDSDPSNPG